MRASSYSFLTSLALILFHCTGFAQTSTFNYQGRLNTGGVPANGLFDLRFMLYPASTNGSAIAGITNTAVPVSNGLFAVALDFGNAAFDGSDRWLEVAARTNGPSAFTALAPRQQIVSTPYATQARNAVLLGGTNGSAFAAAAHTHTANAITSGTISSARGGTGLDTSATLPGSLLHAAGGGAWTTLPPAIDGRVLKLSGGAPTWGQDNNSGGSVTSVGAGTGLTGGPITSTGSLSIDTAVVPRLGASNNFSGVNTFGNASNSFTGTFTGNGASLTNLSGATIVAGSIPGAALAAGSVTNSRLATNSVTSDKILDGTVLTADLADGVVASNKLAGNSVTADKILDGTIAAAELADGAVASNKLASNIAVWTRSGTNATHSGNVGIGTATPAERLHARDDAAGAIRFPIKVSNEAAATYGTAAGVLFQADDGPDRGKGALIYERTDTWNRGKFHFLQEPTAAAAQPGIGNAALTIANNGNVGIANTNPAARLDVAGAIRIQVGGTTVTVNTDGTVNITSSTNITFTSTGDLNLSGRNVTIGASQTMSISGAGGVNINSTAAMNVHAGGALDLQGATIDLN